MFIVADLISLNGRNKLVWSRKFAHSSFSSLVHSLVPKDKLFKNIFQGENFKIFLSETTRPRALIFGMLQFFHVFFFSFKKHEKTSCLKP